MLTRTLIIAALFATTAPTLAQEQPKAADPDEAAIPAPPAFTVRPGYTVSVAALDLDGPRFMAFDDASTLYLSCPGIGEIHTLRDGDNDGYYESRGVFIREMRSVHAMCFTGGWMWFATSGAVYKARDLNKDGAYDELIPVIAPGQLPQGGGHWWRSLLVTRDHIYTSIGDSGNITDETDTARQKIWRFDLDGSNRTLFASGIRNTERLLLRPGTDEIWGIDHGSDNLGQPLGEQTGTRQPVTDFNPPDEFNHYVEGGFYGHPFITGLRIPRYEFQKRRDIIELADKTIVPAWTFGAHWAANSFCFIDPQVNKNTAAFPADHAGDAFVACRGSWNRKEKAGYQIARVLFDPVTGRPYGMLTIVNTLSTKKNVLARPVDCVQAPDGSVLWTCDTTDAIYRIRAEAPADAPATTKPAQ
jgi:glucose/arabinose dehydrogenase